MNYFRKEQLSSSKATHAYIWLILQPHQTTQSVIFYTTQYVASSAKQRQQKGHSMHCDVGLTFKKKIKMVDCIVK